MMKHMDIKARVEKFNFLLGHGNRAVTVRVSGYNRLSLIP